MSPTVRRPHAGPRIHWRDYAGSHCLERDVRIIFLSLLPPKSEWMDGQTDGRAATIN